MERFVADTDLAPSEPQLPSLKASSGKSVVIIGAGPAGLTAAYHLLRSGHACTIADRNAVAGGTLRDHADLPAEVLASEVRLIERMGARFKLGAVLGRDITIEGLLRGFDAVLITLGELSKTDGEALGLEMAPGGIKINSDTFETRMRGVFAAGRAVKPVSHLVRAMAEAQAAAECVRQFLAGKKLRRPDKPFSSIMGRLSETELKAFVAPASQAPKSAGCDTCAGLTSGDSKAEASRCLHCDCRSSGDCALQSYAQLYEANASRFRQERRPFAQEAQPGGVIFEQGKCIACGICVKLTELAREPLGLTFIGRGFNVRLAAPFDHAIADGLRHTAELCVKHCPTGALVLAQSPPLHVHEHAPGSHPKPQPRQT
jgi:ferredoxin